MLGWRILAKADYNLDMPSLTGEEERLISDVQERFREAARSMMQDREQARKTIEALMGSAARDAGLYLDRNQQGYLSEIAFMHIYGFAFMEQLLEDPAVEEISVIGPGKPVYVYLRKQGWMSVNACFDSERAIGDMINRMSRELGRHITMQNPRLDAMLPDGSRLHGSLPPISRGEITIRKFRERPFSPRELQENGTLPADAVALLSVLMQCDLSVLVAGNTASGKTTTMNALFSFIPWNERVLIAEETPEINVPHRHRLRLVANREMGISLKDLVYDSLRMRPDRMIVGEVRNREEVEALFDVLLAGQARGSYATFHAQSAEEAMSRLRSFGVRDGDLKSLDCIIVQRRMLEYDPKERTVREVRKVVEIGEAGGKMLYRPGGAVKGGELLARAGESFGLSPKEMASELKRRKKMISQAGPDYRAFFDSMQQKLYDYGVQA